MRALDPRKVPTTAWRSPARGKMSAKRADSLVLVTTGTAGCVTPTPAMGARREDGGSQDGHQAASRGRDPAHAPARRANPRRLGGSMRPVTVERRVGARPGPR